MRNIPKNFVVNIDRRYQGRGGPFHRSIQERADGPDLPGAGRPGKGGEKPFPRFKGRLGLIKAADFQVQGAEFRPGYPQSQGQGKGPGAKVRNGVPAGQDKG
jgi:hypothetical protein